MDNANKLLFRASSVGKIMGKIGLTEKQSETMAQLFSKETLTAKQKETYDDLCKKHNNPELPDTIKNHLIDLFASSKYGRREEIDSKYLRKGNEQENAAITLFTLQSGKYYKKNEERLSNDFFTGEWDLNAKDFSETIDTKTSWSLHTYLRAIKSELKSDYFYQGQVYMDLTGAKKHTVAFCLVNGTYQAISDEIRRVSYQKGMMDADGNESPEFQKKIRQIEINHIFDLKEFKAQYPFYQFYNDENKWQWDIPAKERSFSFTFDRDDKVIEEMKARVIYCRNWMNNNLFNYTETDLAELNDGILTQKI